MYQHHWEKHSKNTGKMLLLSPQRYLWNVEMTKVRLFVSKSKHKAVQSLKTHMIALRLTFHWNNENCIPGCLSMFKSPVFRLSNIHSNFSNDMEKNKKSFWPSLKAINHIQVVPIMLSSEGKRTVLRERNFQLNVLALCDWNNSQKTEMAWGTQGGIK